MPINIIKGIVAGIHFSPNIKMMIDCAKGMNKADIKKHKGG